MDPLFWTFGLGMPKSVRADITGGWTPEAHGITFPKGVRTTFEFETRDGRPFRLVWFDGEACSQVPVPEQWRGPRNMFPAYNTIELQATRQGMSNGAFAFSLCEDLETVILPDGLLKIGDFAFACCRRLKHVDIPDSVTNVGFFAFDRTPLPPPDNQD